MVAVAAIVGVTTVVGAGVSAVATGKASRAATRANDRSLAAQERARSEGSAALAPFANAGRPASAAIAALLGLAPSATAAPAYSQNGVDYYDDGAGGYTTAKPAGTGALGAQQAAFEGFRNSTGFQFQQEQGNRAIEAALGSRGQLESGAAVKSAARFNSGLAQSSFDNYFSKLMAQQGIGLTAASAQAGIGQNFANNVTNINQSTAQIQGNAALSNAANINSALQSGVQAFGYSQGLRSSFGSGGLI